MVITSPRGQRMKRLLPSLYQDSVVMDGLLQAEGAEFDEVRLAIQDVLNQFYVDTATWTLSRHEAIYGLPPALPGQTDAERRARIKSHKVGFGTATIRVIKLVANSYQNGSVNVDPDFEAHVLTVRFVSVGGLPPNENDLRNAIRNVVPATWRIEYVYTYRTWAMVDAMDGGLGLTWDAQDALGTPGLNKAVSLDGTGDYLSAPDVYDHLFPARPFTLEAWVYKAGAFGGYRRVVDKSLSASTTGWGLEVSDTHIRAFGDTALAVAHVVPNTTWTQIGLISDGAGTGTLVVNGVQIGTGPYTHPSLYQGPLRIGADSAGANAWEGRLDEVIIYPSSLVVGRLNSHYTARNTGNFHNEAIADRPTSHFRLGEQAGATLAIDSGPARAHATPVGNATFGVDGAVTDEGMTWDEYEVYIT